MDLFKKIKCLIFHKKYHITRPLRYWKEGYTIRSYCVVCNEYLTNEPIGPCPRCNEDFIKLYTPISRMCGECKKKNKKEVDKIYKNFIAE